MRNQNEEIREFRAAAAYHLNRAGDARRNAMTSAMFGNRPQLALARRLLACARCWRMRAEQGTYNATGL